MVEEARGKAGKKLAEDDEEPETEIQSIRRKAKAKIEASQRRLEQEKKDQVERIIGDTKPVPESFDPNVVRLEALIREVRKVLNSTPPLMKVKVESIVEKVGGKSNVDEIESIIVGLVSRKEVKGEYNIWNRTFGGSPSQRFTDRTLEDTTIDTDNLKSIRLDADGTVEFKFKPKSTSASQNEEKGKSGQSKK